MRGLLIAASATALIVFALFACSRSESGSNSSSATQNNESGNPSGLPDVQPPQPLKVAVLQLTQQRVAVRGSYLGYAAPNTRVVLRSENEGKVEVALIAAGEEVHKDRILIHIATGQRIVERERARANMKMAASDLSRDRELFRKKLIPRSRLDVSAGLEREAYFTLQLAEHNLKKSKIRSPLDGEVSVKSIEVGEFVRKGDALAEIVSLDPIVIEIYVPGRDVPFLRERHAATIEIESLPGRVFAGFVKSMGMEADPQQGSFPVDIEIANPQGIIRPGMLARVEIVLRILPHQIVIPRKLVQDRQNGYAVYVISGGRAVERSIQIGIRLGDRVQVTSGLRDKESVAMSNLNDLSDSVPVRVSKRTRQAALN